MGWKTHWTPTQGYEEQLCGREEEEEEEEKPGQPLPSQTLNIEVVSRLIKRRPTQTTPAVTREMNLNS